MSAVTLKVNGRTVTVDVDTSTPLLYILRNDLLLNGPRFGCGLGQCGACTVIVEGEAIRSCITPTSSVEGFEITTIEGLNTGGKLHPIINAFAQHQAAQCGYCINGFVLTAKVFIDTNPKATETEIREALQGNLCRCGTHMRILAATKQYAQEVGA
ncbi:MAG: (2Fe-2S)-binding protein [Acidobacteria bacterium]|nr:(2Fe-2S)-binding protein [Acidobacteriota bacterium]